MYLLTYLLISQNSIHCLSLLLSVPAVLHNMLLINLVIQVVGGTDTNNNKQHTVECKTISFITKVQSVISLRYNNHCFTRSDSLLIYYFYLQLSLLLLKLSKYMLILFYCISTVCCVSFHVNKCFFKNCFLNVALFITFRYVIYYFSSSLFVLFIIVFVKCFLLSLIYYLQFALSYTHKDSCLVCSCQHFIHYDLCSSLL